MAMARSSQPVAIVLMLLLAPGSSNLIAAGRAAPTAATSAPVMSPPMAAATVPPGPDLARFLATNRPAYLEAMRRARAWLDALHVDPLELRGKGIKGKKKLVEQLEAYYRLWRIAPAAAKEPLLVRIKSVVGVTYEDRYHDMGSISDAWFRQDATSYLRAAFLMDRLGLDTRRYHREIAKIQPRLDAQMSRRGANQQEAFHLYYRHFGLQEPFPLETALQNGVIAARTDPAALSTSQVYDLTHEVYAPYDYGDRLDVDPFSEADRAYLRSALTALAARYIDARDSDPLAEVLECLHYLRFEAAPGYRAGVSFLLARQNQDGSWGTYPRERKLLGEFVRQGFQLHTTLVAILALTAVFDEPMPPPALNHTASSRGRR
jgi:hypothetical protein